MTLDELRQWFSDLEIDGSIELNVIFYGHTLYIEGLGRKVKEDSNNLYQTNKEKTDGKPCSSYVRKQ